jgi:disulfide bond formation protein DsbB
MISDATPSPRRLLLLALGASIAVVGTALLFQYVGGLAPCELCLYQRWPYYAVIALAALALVAGNDAAIRWALALAALIFALGTALAVYHAGVEYHWFPGPTACTGGTSGAQTIEQLRAQLLGRQPVSCDEPAWRLFGISLAGWNVLASLLLTLFCAASFLRLGPGRRGRAVHV